MLDYLVFAIAALLVVVAALWFADDLPWEL